MCVSPWVRFDPRDVAAIIRPCHRGLHPTLTPGPPRSSPERQLQLLCLVHGVVQRGDLPLPSMLQAMMERVLLPLASHCSPGALALFFLENVSDVMALLLSRFTKVVGCSQNAVAFLIYM